MQNAPEMLARGILILLMASLSVSVWAGEKPSPKAWLPEGYPLKWPFDSDDIRKRRLAAINTYDLLTEITLDLPQEEKLKLVLIPPGRFVMGAHPSVLSHEAGELQHEVFITRPYYVSVTEVTESQWRSLEGVVSGVHTRGDDLPMTGIRLDIAEAWCAKLSKYTRQQCRLPTEAEWEFACRAGRAGKLSDEEKQAEAWYASSRERWHAKPTGTKKPNAFGIYDMLGNARELVCDWGPEHVGLPVADPRGPRVEPRSQRDRRWATRGKRRGGSWPGSGQGVGMAFQGSQGDAFSSTGLRVVMDPYPDLPFNAKLPSYQSTPGERAAQRRQKESAAAISLPLRLDIPVAGALSLPFVYVPAITDGAAPYYLMETELSKAHHEFALGRQSAENSRRYYWRDRPYGWTPGYLMVAIMRGLRRATELPLRLPSEQEWLHAYGADGTFGPKSLNSDTANIDHSSTIAWTRGALLPVGRLRPNAWGLYDMAGNVAEYSAPPGGLDYEKMDANRAKVTYVMLGGAWISPPGESGRNGREEYQHGSTTHPHWRKGRMAFGVRLVLDVEAAKKHLAGIGHSSEGDRRVLKEEGEKEN
ncbi:MAG: sulfatase activating formylglycine-generating enzyme [Rhodothermales bacterium]|jgi:formylglycine-generating enzyme required for sulfatase activity